MRQRELHLTMMQSPHEPDYLRLALFFVGIASLGSFWFILGSPASEGGTRLFILPWCAAVAVVTLAPIAFQIVRKKFDPFHPLVFPMLTYFFPGFAVGGLILAFGYSHFHYITYIQDERTNLPLTFLFVIMGLLGLFCGFALPIGRRLGRFFGDRLPSWKLSDGDAKKGGTILLLIGLFNVVLAFTFGTLGFQRTEEVSGVNGIIMMSTLFWPQATFLLALRIFRAPRLDLFAYTVLTSLVAAAVVFGLLNGNRGGLFGFAIPLVFAFFYSGRSIVTKHYVGAAAVLLFALIVGVIYGTTFRGLRGSQEQVSFDRYVSVVPRTFEAISNQDPVHLFESGLLIFAERIELVSSSAVIVSNYEVLAPYEEQMGISDNIWVETTTFFIPRILWNDKPVAIAPSKYADLYFNYSENSFSITPIGDLLRNFGPIGIPVGMLILGILLRVIYVALIDGHSFSYWKCTLYYVLLTSISYDGAYGAILPGLIKATIVASVGFVIVWLVTFRFNKDRTFAR